MNWPSTTLSNSSVVRRLRTRVRNDRFKYIRDLPVGSFNKWGLESVARRNDTSRMEEILIDEERRPPYNQGILIWERRERNIYTLCFWTILLVRMSRWSIESASEAREEREERRREREGKSSSSRQSTNRPDKQWKLVIGKRAETHNTMNLLTVELIRQGKNERRKVKK